MLRPIVAAAITALMPIAASACITNTAGVGHHLTGPDLRAGRSFDVVAGGEQSLRSCGFLGTGYVQPDPNFSFYLSEMEDLSLIASVAASCDTILIVTSVNIDFFFDDDSGGDLNPQLTVPGGAALNGRLDTWVGTYHSESCAAVLTLQTVSQ